MPAIPENILALDFGAQRVGVAVASIVARLPGPLTTLQQDDNFWPVLEYIIESKKVGLVIVGYPRGMQGQHTDQTTAVETFVTELRQHVTLPVQLQDEALTSQKAKAELKARGKIYSKEDIDALAATYILDDFLASHPQLEFDETTL